MVVSASECVGDGGNDKGRAATLEQYAKNSMVDFWLSANTHLKELE